MTVLGRPARGEPPPLASKHFSGAMTVLTIAGQLVIVSTCAGTGIEAQANKERFSGLYRAFADPLTAIAFGYAVLVVIGLVVWLRRSGILMAVMSAPTLFSGAVALAGIFRGLTGSYQEPPAPGWELRSAVSIACGAAGVFGIVAAVRRPRLRAWQRTR